MGCPLAAAALAGCWLDCRRWIQHHLSVSASFVASRWSAKVVQLVRVSPLWPASWVSAVGKSRGSKSVEVTDVWEIYDRCLQLVPVADALAIGDAVVSRDDLAWEIWSAAAERASPLLLGWQGVRSLSRVWFLVERRLSSGYVVLVLRK